MRQADGPGRNRLGGEVVEMAIVMDYIAKCGCRIRVDDAAYAGQPPEVLERRRREVDRCIDGIRWRYAERLVRAEMEKEAREEPGG